MNKLLQSDFIGYLKSLNPNVRDVDIKDVRIEVITDTHFDIQDLKPTIKQKLGTGSAIYNNPNNKRIAIIDYEDFLNKQPQQPAYPSSQDIIKALELKKPDFIVYDLGTNSFFILNELSQSGNSNNKRNDAKLQLYDALKHFYKVTTIKTFIKSFPDKRCVFSNRNPVNSPDDIADSFEFIRKSLQLNPPEKLNFQPITKLGFELIETNIIDV